MLTDHCATLLFCPTGTAVTNLAREGITMGHAGAMIQGDVGTITSKTEALAGAGAHVFTRIRDLVDAVARGVGKAKGEKACS